MQLRFYHNFERVYLIHNVWILTLYQWVRGKFNSSCRWSHVWKLATSESAFLILFRQICHQIQFNFNWFIFLSMFWCFQESLLTYFLLSWVGLSKALHLAATMFVCPHIFLLPFPSVNWIFQARPGRSYWGGPRQNPSPTPKQTFHCWIINIGPFTTTLTYASAIADDAGDDDDDRNYIQILMFFLFTHTIAHYAHLPLCDHCAGSSKLSKLKKKNCSKCTSQRYFEVYT